MDIGQVMHVAHITGLSICVITPDTQPKISEAGFNGHLSGIPNRTKISHVSRDLQVPFTFQKLQCQGSITEQQFLDITCPAGP